MNNIHPMRISFLFLSFPPIFLFSLVFVLKFFFLFLREVLGNRKFMLLLFLSIMHIAVYFSCVKTMK